MGAALSYYTIFSVAPLLLVVISIAGFVFGADAAAGHIYRELQGLVGAEGAATIQSMVKSASTPQRSVIGTIAGFATLLVGATTVFAELQSALDRIWRVPAPKREGILALVRNRVLSFGLVLAIGFLLLISLIVTAALSALGAWWAPAFGSWEVLLQIANFAVSFAIVTVLFAAIYKWLPRARIGWRDVWIGAVVTSVLFTIGKQLIGLYIGKSGVVSGFGAAGSVVVMLIWVYYSAQIFLLGAEFTWLYAYRFGSRRGQQPAPPPVQATGSNDDKAAAGAGNHVTGPRRPSRSQPAPVPSRSLLHVARAAALAAATAFGAGFGLARLTSRFGRRSSPRLLP
jgi:membrane protein